MAKTKINTKNLMPYLIVTLLVVAIFGIFLFLLLPQFRFFQEARGIRKQASIQFTSVNSELKALQNTLEEIDNLSEGQKVAMSKSLPIGQDLEEFLRSFHRLAQASGVIIVNLNISQDDANRNQSEEESAGPTGTVIKSNISMTIRSSQQNFLKFVQSLERNVRLIDVIDVSLNDATTAADNTDIINANLNGALYHLDGVPATPAFPYSHSLDTSLFESPQFQNLNISN